MKITTITRPSSPAARLSFTDWAPNVALTCVTSRATRSTGSDPELIPVARSLALVCVNDPEMVAWPPAISCSVIGSVRNFPQMVPCTCVARHCGSYGCITLATYDGSSQLSMSCWVRSSQIVRWRWGQFAVAVVLGSPGQALTLSRVRLSNLVAPAPVKLTLTTQLVPVLSIDALALEMSSPVKPVSCGL